MLDRLNTEQAPTPIKLMLNFQILFKNQIDLDFNNSVNKHHS